MFFVFKQNSNCGDTFILKVWNFKVKQFVGVSEIVKSCFYKF